MNGVIMDVPAPRTTPKLADLIEAVYQANAPLPAVADRVSAAVRFLRTTAGRLDGEPAGASSAQAVAPQPETHGSPAPGMAARERLVVTSLHYLITREDRDTRRAARRVHDAGFSRNEILADFDFTANAPINPATINALAGCPSFTKGQFLCQVGGSWIGKSPLLIALGTAARGTAWQLQETVRAPSDQSRSR